MSAGTQNLAITRRSVFGLAAVATATCILPTLPRRATGSDSASAGPIEVVSYDAIAERGWGVTRISTPWYSITLEDGLFPQGVCWEYDEGGLGFDAQGVTKACSVLRVYDRGTGDLSFMAYLTDKVTASNPLVDDEWIIASKANVESGLMLVLSCYAGPDKTDSEAYDRLCALHERLSLDDRSTHLQRDALARVTTVEAPLYKVAIPDGMFPQGWRYVYRDSSHYFEGTQRTAHCHTSVFPAGGGEGYYGVYASRGLLPQGEYAVEDLGSCAAHSWDEWRLVAYKPADYSARTYEEERGLLASFSATVSHKASAYSRDLPAVFAAWEEEGLRVVTPHYSVLIPPEQIGPGFDWAYSEGAVGGEPPEDGRVRVTRIDLDGENGVSFEVFCQLGSAETPPEGSVVGATGLTSPEGLPVVVASSGAELDEYARMVWRADVEWTTRYDTEQYFVYTVDEGDATRIVTPYYSVRVPRGVYGDEFTFDFEHGSAAREIDYDGAMVHRMMICFYRQGELADWFEVYCLRGDAPAADGPAVFARSGVTSTDGLHVDAFCMFASNPGGELPPDAVTAEQARAKLEDYILMIEPAPADAPVIERLRGNTYRQRPGEVDGIRPAAE